MKLHPDVTKENCKQNYNRMIKRFQTLEEDFRKVHSDKYDYKISIYRSINTPIEIICPSHGSFWQTPANHLSGNECPKCRHIKKGKSRRKTTEQFIKEAKEIHGDKYDYSVSNYIRNDIPIKIICPVHGVIEQTPTNHKQGIGCPYCAGNIKYTYESFISKSIEKFGNKYNKSLVKFVDSTAPVILKCNTCGNIFEITPCNHLYSKNGGCKKCRANLASIRQKTNNTGSHNKKYHSEEKRKQILEKQSKSMKEKIAKGEFTPCITNSWCHSRCEINNISFRSSWEAMFYLLNPYLEYETIRIPYIDINGIQRNYIVDFIDEQNKIIYEIKPSSKTDDANVILKEKYAKKWCKNNEYKYIFITEDWIDEHRNEIINNLHKVTDKETLRKIKANLKI